MKASSIDIYSLNFILFSSFRHKALEAKPLFNCIIIYLYDFFKVVFKKGGRKYPSSQPILVYSPSINNQRTTDPIVSNLDDGNYTYWRKTDGHLPVVRIHLISLFYSFSFLAFYFKQSKDDKRLIRRFFDIFFTTVGRFKVIDRFFHENPQLKILVMANDHNQTNRCMIELAEKYGIKTIYTQHASVTDRFPALHFDYSFLDGLESFEKYDKVGNIRGKVFLSGSPRYDLLHDYAGQCKSNVIGIGLSEADKVEKVIELCSYIKSRSNYEIIIRPHPRTEPTFPSDMFINQGVSVSFPSKENSLSFLSQVSILIANESGIHLDAAIMHKSSIMYNFSDNEVMDWYGFIKQGLITCCTFYDEVLQQTENPPPVPSETIQYYYAAYNTPQEGNVGMLISKLINYVMENKNIDDYISQYFIDTKRGYYHYR